MTGVLLYSRRLAASKSGDNISKYTCGYVQKNDAQTSVVLSYEAKFTKTNLSAPQVEATTLLSATNRTNSDAKRAHVRQPERWSQRSATAASAFRRAFFASRESPFSLRRRSCPSLSFPRYFGRMECASSLTASSTMAAASGWRNVT